MSNQYSAWFTCTGPGCGCKYELNEVIYSCKKCGELLSVEHDIEKLKERSPGEWKAQFDQRRGSFAFPHQSGIWSKKEVVLPDIRNENIVSSGEGYTHLYDAARFAKELGLSALYVKQCGVSHTGSFKDLGMTVLVSQVKQMMDDGVKIKAVACASTGDTSAALASYASKAGIPSIVFLPDNKVSPAQLIQPVSNGAIVISIDTDFDGCMKLVQEVTREEGIYLANSMNSLRVEGQKTISFEIIQQLGWEVPDWVIIPGGNLGNVSALGAGFEMMLEMGLIQKAPRIAVAQARNANPLLHSYLDEFKTFKPVQAQKTEASAIQIGNPVSVKKAIRILKKFGGVVEDASEEELANAASRGDRFGLYNDPHTGVALAATIKLREKNTIRAGESAVVISTANGLKFTEFKVKFHSGMFENSNKAYINEIRKCPPNAGNLIDLIRKSLQS